MSIDRIWSLLAKKFNEEISKAEQEELEALLRENQAAFQANEFLYGLKDLQLKPILDPAAEITSKNAIKDALSLNDSGENAVNELGAYSDRSTGARKRKLVIGMAAIFTFLVIGTITWAPFRKNSSSGKQVAVNEIKTDAGTKTTINLPDGSVAILNAGSKLSYNKEFGINSREITLTGEAYFDIQKNANIPLVVHAGTVEVWVKGTTFNVKAYPEDSTIEAALLTGAIELVSKNDPERKILLRPNEKIIITQAAGQELLAPIGENKLVKREETISLSKMKPDPIDSSYAEMSWLQNKLVFRGESFGQLARYLERRYNVRIVFNDRSVSELIFTGSFTNETLNEALEALKGTVPFHYTIKNKTVFISK